MNNNDSYPSATQVDLFEENEFVEYTEASNTQRFLNYLIDYFFSLYAVDYAVGYLLGTIVMTASPEAAEYFFGDDTSTLPIFLIGIINHILYYTICEKAFRGYTLGKLITGTRTIRTDGEELTFKDALLRSLSRIVPFEPFSIWSENGLWHDHWTKTKVIKSR